MSAPTPQTEPSGSTPAQVAAGDEVTVVTATGMRLRRPSSCIRGHDFRQSGFLAPSELRRIRQRHEQFVRALAARLSVLLRLEVTVTLGKVQIVGYQKFVEALPTPAHITLFKTDPLKGVGLLVVAPRLGLAVVDRLLGGPGQISDATRDLTELETALFDQVTSLLLNEWCLLWPEKRDLKASLLGHETNSRYLQTAPPDAAMLVLSMEAGMAEQREVIHLAFPYSGVEPLVRLLAPPVPGEDILPAPAGKVQWNSKFDDVPVPVVALWDGLTLSAAEVSRLQPGDVLTFDPARAAQVQLWLGRRPKFLGRPGSAGGKWAVQLIQPIQD